MNTEKSTPANDEKSKAMNPQMIKPHMAVVCSENGEFAKVDHLDGKSLKLTKDDKGQHHFIPLEWVKKVDDKVHIDRPGKQAMKEWSNKPIA